MLSDHEERELISLSQLEPYLNAGGLRRLLLLTREDDAAYREHASEQITSLKKSLLRAKRRVATLEGRDPDSVTVDDA